VEQRNKVSLGSNIAIVKIYKKHEVTQTQSFVIVMPVMCKENQHRVLRNPMAGDMVLCCNCNYHSSMLNNIRNIFILSIIAIISRYAAAAITLTQTTSPPTQQQR
jgi:hypothetical protein